MEQVRLNLDLQTIDNLATWKPQGLASRELFARWLGFLDRMEKTVESYSRKVKQWADYLEARNIASPTRETVLDYKRSLEEKGLKPGSINSYLTALRRLYSWAEVEGYYQNIAREIRNEKQGEGHSKEALSVSQGKELLGNASQNTLTGLRDRAILSLMLTCGLRDIEIARANVEDIGTEGGETVIHVQGKGKTDRLDFVKLPEATERAIRQYLLARGQAGTGLPMFTSLSNNNAGKRMASRSVSAIVKGYLRAIGLGDSRHTAHSLRHTAVTLSLIGNGGNVQETQQFARHKSIATTMVYAHNLDKAKNRCADIVSAMLMD